MPVYGYTSVRTNNRSGPYPIPSATGQTIVVAAFFFPDGGTATTTVMTFIVTRLTGATVTVSEPEHSNSRSPNQSGGGGVAESVAGTFSGNPFVIVKSAPENLYPPGHYQFPRPQARFVTNGGELSQVSTKVNPGTGISAAFGLRYAEGGLGGAIDRVARRPREHGWWHRSAQKRHKVQAGTTPPASSQDVHDRANWNIMSAARQAYLRQHDMPLVVRAGAAGAQTTANVTDTGVTQTDSVNRAIVRRGLTDIGVSQVDTVLSAETFDLHNPFQGTSGNVISTANSGAGGTADFFDFVTGSPVYGTAHPNSGSTSMSLQTAAGAASAGWDVSIPTTEILYGRVYWYAAAANGATTRIVTIAGDATSLLGNISLDTSNRLTANIGNFGTTVVASNPLTTSAMARIEWLITVDRHGNGMLKVRYFLSKDSLTPDEEITATNVGVPDQRIFSCSVGVTAAATVNTWLDDFEVSNAGWIGPFGGAQAFQADVTDNGVIQSDTIGRAVTRKVADTGVAQSDALTRAVVRLGIQDDGVGFGFTDTFTRTAGPSALGGSWTIQSGASAWSVDGSEAVSTPTAGQQTDASLDTGSPNHEVRTRLRWDVAPVASSRNQGIRLRSDAAANNDLRIRLSVGAGGTGNVNLVVSAVVANVATSIYNNPVVAGNPQAGEWWWIQAAAEGSRVRVWVWKDGTPRPVAPDADVTDTTVPANTLVMMTAQRLAGETTAPTLNWDDFSWRVLDTVTATFQAGGASTTRNVTDTGVSQSDAVQRQIVRPMTSTGVSQSDTLGRAVTRAVADTMTQTDNIGPRAITRAVTSTGLAQSDSIGPRQITRAITSTGVSQSDALSRAVVRGVADQGATQTDSPGRAVARPPISADWTPVTGAWLLANVNLTGSNADWATREASLGRSFDGRMKYKAIDTTTLSDLNVGDTFASVAYPTAGTLSFSGNNTIPSINAGSQDANLIAFANAVKAIAPTRVFVRLFWEFNLAANRFNPANYVDASGVAAPGTWADFQTAWIRVWTIFFGTAADFTALGITGTPPGCSHDQVKFAYNPNRKAGASPVDPTLGYPGSRYVDWIFLDTYPSRVSGATEVLDSPTVLLTKPNVASAVSWYDTFASYGKPLGIGETSVHPVDDVTTAYGSGNGVSPVTRVQWWSLWVAALKALPRVKLVTIFDANDAGYPTSNHTWKTDAASATTGDSGSQAFAAYSAFANDAWMNPSGSGGLASDTGVYFYDSLTATVSHGAVNVADTGVSQSDTLARAVVRGVASTGASQSDTVAPTRGFLRGVTDTGAAQSDAVATARTRAIADTGAAQSDSIARTAAHTVGIADTGTSQTDVTTTTRLRPIVDTGASQSDALARAVVRGVADTGETQTDSIARTRLVTRNVTDTGEAQTDTIGRAVVRAVTSTGVAQTDTVQASSGGRNNVTDTGTSQSDSIARAITRPVTSTGVTQTDSVTRTRAVTRNVTDTGESQSDALAVARIRAISDTGASQTDSPATARVRAIATIGVAQTDAVGRAVVRGIADIGESQTDALGGAQSFSRNVTDTGVAQSDQVGRLLQPYGVVDYGVGERVASDEFNRTVTATTSASWGTLDTGQTWTVMNTVAGQTYGVNGSQATNTVAPSTSARRGQTIPAGGANQEVVGAFALDVLPIGGSYANCVWLRVTDVNNLYSVDMLVTTTGNIQYRLRKVIANAGTNIVAAANVPGIGTYTPGSLVWVRGRIEGQTLSVKVWKDGTPEPSAWTVQAVDTSIATGSLAGVGGQASGTQTNSPVQMIDHVAIALVQSDVVGRTVTPGIADTGDAQTDTVARAVTRAVTDQGATMSDSIGTTAAGHVSITDQGVSQSDLTRRAILRGVADAGTSMSDAVRAAHAIGVSDAGASMADQVARLKTAPRAPTDTGVAQIDVLARAVARPIADTGASQTDMLSVAGHHDISITDVGVTFSDGVDLTAAGHQGVTDVGLTETDAVRRAIVRRLADVGVAESDVVVIRKVLTLFLADRGVRFSDFVGAIRRVLTSVEGVTGQAQTHGVTGEPQVNDTARLAGPHDGTRQPIVYAHTED